MFTYLTKFTFLLIVIMLSFSQYAEAWTLFGPSDYEECSDEAAKESNSDAALKVMLTNCNTKFRARRKAGGGYRYCENIYRTSNQRVCIDVDSPEISRSDINRVVEKANKARAQSEEAKYRSEQLYRSIAIESWNVVCNWTAAGRALYDPAFADELGCTPRAISVTIINNNDYSVSEVGFGLILSQTQTSCAGNLQEIIRIKIFIPAHEYASFNFNLAMTMQNHGNSHGCLSITSASS